MESNENGWNSVILKKRLVDALKTNFAETEQNSSANCWLQQGSCRSMVKKSHIYRLSSKILFSKIVPWMYPDYLQFMKYSFGGLSGSLRFTGDGPFLMWFYDTKSMGLWDAMVNLTIPTSDKYGVKAFSQPSFQIGPVARGGSVQNGAMLTLPTLQCCFT